jgi:hypothetical protein
MLLLSNNKGELTMINNIISALKEEPYKGLCAVGGVVVYSSLMYLGSEGKPLNKFRDYLNDLINKK